MSLDVIPLCIEYVVDEERGVFFGWALERSRINPYQIPMYDSRTMATAELTGIHPQTIQEQILGFFNGALSADLNIPKRYPYELYERGKEELISSGRLRDQ